jgi:hypothetical protein
MEARGVWERAGRPSGLEQKHAGRWEWMCGCGCGCCGNGHCCHYYYLDERSSWKYCVSSEKQKQRQLEGGVSVRGCLDYAAPAN